MPNQVAAHSTTASVGASYTVTMSPTREPVNLDP
jgi:hypothetical protein